MKRGILVLLMLGLPLLLQAQDDGSEETITLKEAIDIALENNYQLKQAKNNLELAEKGIINEYADFVPSVSGNLNVSSRQGQQLVRSGDTQIFEDNVTNGLSGGLSANIPIFNGFDNILSLRMSRADKLSSEESYQRAKENVIFNTASNFLQVLLDEQLLEIAEENLETSRKQLEQVEAQVEVGSRPKVDLYNQEAQVANNEFTVTQRENNLKLSRLALIRQLQIDPLGDYEFTTPDLNIEQMDPSISSAPEYSVENLVEEALSNRSDLKSEQANLRQLKLQLLQSKYALLPSLNGSAGLNSSYNDQYFGGGVSFQDQFWDQNLTKSIGLSLSIPIFNNWNRMHNIQTSKINLRNAELGLENTRLQIVQEVNQAYTDYQAILKQLEASQKALQAAERSYLTEKERYNVGASTLIELSNANTQYVQAQSDRAQALFNYVFQRKLLDYYLGKLDEDISIQQ